MIFSPRVLFGHTWEYDAHSKCIRALIDRNLFYGHFVKNSTLKCEVSERVRLGNIEFVNVILSIHDLKKKQIKVTYEMEYSSGDFILSQPLTADEKLILHKFRLLCYQHNIPAADIEAVKPKNIFDLEMRDIDALDNYSIKIGGIDEERLVIHLFNWMYNQSLQNF